LVLYLISEIPDTSRGAVNRQQKTLFLIPGARENFEVGVRLYVFVCCPFPFMKKRAYTNKKYQKSAIRSWKNELDFTVFVVVSTLYLPKRLRSRVFRPRVFLWHRVQTISAKNGGNSRVTRKYVLLSVLSYFVKPRGIEN